MLHIHSTAPRIIKTPTISTWMKILLLFFHSFTQLFDHPNSLLYIIFLILHGCPVKFQDNLYFQINAAMQVGCNCFILLTKNKLHSPQILSVLRIGDTCGNIDDPETPFNQLLFRCPGMIRPEKSIKKYNIKSKYESCKG